MHSAAEFQAEERHSRIGPLIALTGATGFIGRHILREMPKRGYRFRVLLRRPVDIPLDCASAVIGDLARPRQVALLAATPAVDEQDARQQRLRRDDGRADPVAAHIEGRAPFTYRHEDEVART